MEHTISATDLVRRLGDILARVRYRHESFVVERSGTPVARIVPVQSAEGRSTLGDALAAWCTTRDPSFADDLTRIGRSDRPPANPWAS
jgi:prevent-host-death family protein